MSDGGWQNGLFSHVCGGSCGTCLGAWFCGCCLFGREAKRLDQFPEEEAPNFCNGDCFIMCAASLCHLHWVPALLKRGEVRSKFGINGDGCTDCLASYFCFPCTLAQMDTEVKSRARMAHGMHGKNGGYSQPQQGMVYQQPGQY